MNGIAEAPMSSRMTYQARVVTADTAEGAPRHKPRRLPGARRLGCVLGVTLVALLVLSRSPSLAQPPIEVPAGSEGAPKLPTGDCLVTRWQSIWRIHADASRSYIAHPTPGCAGRAREVNDLEHAATQSGN